MELEQLPEIQRIVNIGKANGEITYDEINDILPEKLINSDKIDDVFILLNQYGIEIVEEYDKKSAKEPKILAESGRLRGFISKLQKSSGSRGAYPSV